MERASVVLAGAAQLGLVAVGLAVPAVFGWRADLARLRPANRRLFWVYGAFIAGANLGFGALSLAFPAEIAAGRGAAGGLALFLGTYWGARLGVELLAFDTPDWLAAARRPAVKAGLAALFLALTATYLACFFRGLGE
jgi:hypothetical protein